MLAWRVYRAASVGVTGLPTSAMRHYDIVNMWSAVVPHTCLPHV